LRYQSWNYAGNGWYFVTICTKERMSWFGNIDEKGNMRLNDFGKIIKEEWRKIAEGRSNVELDEYSIMQDHFHGIIAVYNDEALEPDDLPKKDHWQKGCLGVIINQFKGACTRRIRDEGHHSFSWQRNFNDHIIRNEKDLERIRKYIRENPEAWVYRNHS
jgi:REP element-mobilizing transposase RayT